MASRDLPVQCPLLARLDMCMHCFHLCFGEYFAARTVCQGAGPLQILVGERQLQRKHRQLGEKHRRTSWWILQVRDGFASTSKCPGLDRELVHLEVAGELELGDATVQLNGAWSLFF